MDHYRPVDFLRELKTRHAERRERKVRLSAELRQVEAEEAALWTIIDAEERKRATDVSEPGLPLRMPESGEEMPPVAPPHHAATSPLRRAVLNELSDGEIWLLQDLATSLQAKGQVPPGIDKLGRSLQGTLLSLAHQGVVEHVGTGRWKIKVTMAEAL